MAHNPACSVDVYAIIVLNRYLASVTSVGLIMVPWPSSCSRASLFVAGPGLRGWGVNHVFNGMSEQLSGQNPDYVRFR